VTRKHAFLLIIVIVVAVLYSGYTSAYRAVVHAQTDVLPFDSPLPTPIPPEAEMALHFVAAQHGIPQDRLAFGSQETLTFPLLGRSYTYVTVHYDAPDGFQLFAVLVDPAAKTVEPDFNAVRAAEEAAYRARYGKLNASNYGGRWVYLPLRCTQRRRTHHRFHPAQRQRRTPQRLRPLLRPRRHAAHFLSLHAGLGAGDGTSLRT